MKFKLIGESVLLIFPIYLGSVTQSPFLSFATSWLIHGHYFHTCLKAYPIHQYPPCFINSRSWTRQPLSLSSLLLSMLGIIKLQCVFHIKEIGFYRNYNSCPWSNSFAESDEFEHNLSDSLIPYIFSSQSLHKRVTLNFSLSHT